MKKIIYHNSLSIVFLLLFVLAMIGQTVCGINEYNKELAENGAAVVNLSQSKPVDAPHNQTGE